MCVFKDSAAGARNNMRPNWHTLSTLAGRAEPQRAFLDWQLSSLNELKLKESNLPPIRLLQGCLFSFSCCNKMSNRFACGMSGRLKPVIGTLDDNRAGLGPPPSLSNSAVSIQVPFRFQLPIPDDFSDCISELHVLGRLQIELDKSITRVQQAIANGSYSPDPYPQYGVTSPGAAGISLAQELNPSGKAPTAQAAQTLARQPTKDLHTNGFPLKHVGFAASPQPDLMLSSLQNLTAALPATALLESPVHHELSAISYAPLTLAGKEAGKADSISNLHQQESLIENCRLFLTPAPLSRASPPSQLRPLERADFGINPKPVVEHALQRDVSRFQSSKSRIAGSNSSALESSATGAITLERAPADRPPTSIASLGDSARKLSLKLQEMDAKNREIDTLLVQFLQRKTASRNASFQTD